MTDREKPRRTAADFHPEVLSLFDKYVHGAIDRRGFLTRRAVRGRPAVTAAGLLAALSPSFAAAQQVPQGRPARSRPSTWNSRRPKATARRAATWWPGRAAAHGNAAAWCWWCTRTAASIRTSRTSRAGWRWTTSSPSRPTRCSRSAAIRATRTRRANCSASWTRPRRREDFVAAATLLQRCRAATASSAWSASATAAASPTMLADAVPKLAAAVPFYGTAPAGDEVAKIKAPLLLHFAENDERINAAWPAYEAALKAAGVQYEVFQLPRHAARLQQRHHAALRRRGRQAGLAAHAGLLQPGIAPLSAGPAPPVLDPAILLLLVVEGLGPVDVAVPFAAVTGARIASSAARRARRRLAFQVNSPSIREAVRRLHRARARSNRCRRRSPRTSRSSSSKQAATTIAGKSFSSTGALRAGAGGTPSW